MPIKGIVIAGTHSGCGKTTITLGILAALKKKGLTVQSFKAGPDFIDSGLHRLITGRPSRNLDAWMCGEEYVKKSFQRYSDDADMSIIEGVMGMYDGEYSTAKLARLLNLPVILVVDAYGIAESAGAVVRGFSEFSHSPIHPFTHSPISGVIFNRVASERHYERLKRSVSDIKVLGCLPRDLNFEIPHRHLGLTVAEENPITKENIGKLADAVLGHVNVDSIIKIQPPISPLTKGELKGVVESGLFPTPKIAFAYDKAFCFYYEDNLDLLRKAGAEIITFSPLSDKKIPDEANAIYIGGGYPELYAKELSGNNAMLKSIKKWSEAGKPLYAECGGLMYLSQGIYDFEENFLKMASVFSFKTQMKKGRAHLGYREIELRDNCILGKKGDRVRGHEFHYSEIKPSTGTVQDFSPRRIRLSAEQTQPPLSPLTKGELKGVVESGLSPSAGEIYSVKDNHGEFANSSGYRHKKTLASYVHIHFGSNLGIAKNFIDFIKER